MRSLLSARAFRFLVVGLIGCAATAAFAEDGPALTSTPPAGVFDKYVLAMSDENDFCAENPSKIECKGAAASFGMALHGFWPDRNADPQHTYQYCGSVTNAQLEKDWCASQYDVRSQLSDPTFAALVAVMPGTQSCLYNHEWYAHGTCSGLTVDQYFGDAQALAAKFIALSHFHDLLTSMAGKTVSKAQLTAAMVADLGPGSENSILLLCRKAGHGSTGDSFTEVDLTLDLHAYSTFPASASLGQNEGKDGGNCPAQGILLTAPVALSP